MFKCLFYIVLNLKLNDRTALFDKSVFISRNEAVKGMNDAGFAPNRVRNNNIVPESRKFSFLSWVK